MTDQPHDLPGLVRAAHHREHVLVPPELVGRPPARHHDRVELVDAHVAGRDVARGQQTVLPGHLRACLRPDDRDVGALLPQAHHRDPELQILEALVEEHRHPSAVEPAGHRHARSASSAFGTVASGVTPYQACSIRPSPSTKKDDRMMSTTRSPFERIRSPQVPYASATA